MSNEKQVPEVGLQPPVYSPSEKPIDYHRDSLAKAAAAGFTDENALVEVLAHDIFGERHGPAAASPPAPVEETPASPPKPEPEDVALYKLHEASSEFDEIRSTMLDYVARLPENEAQAIRTDYRKFNEVYARVRKTMYPEDLPSTYDDLPPDIREKVVRSKEINAYEKTPEPAPSPQELGERRLGEIKKELKRPDLDRVSREELTAEMAWFFRPPKA